MTENVFAPPRANLDVHEGPEALWEMGWKDLRKLYLASVNVRTLGVLYALAALGSLGVGVAVLAGYFGRSDSGAGPGLVGSALVVLGLGYVAGCVTSYARPAWGRWLGCVLCVLALPSVPFGTIIGALGLVAYAQGGKLFGPARLLHKDVAAVYKQRRKER